MRTLTSLDRFGQKNTLLVVRDLHASDNEEIESQLWNQLVFESYYPANDDGYLRALNLLSSQIMISNDPDVMLGSLQRMARWLELLGMSEMIQWIRELIRREAPGTRYVDNHDRINYLHTVQVSDYLNKQVTPILMAIQHTAPIRLSQLLGTSAMLKKSKTLPKTLKP